MLRSIPSRFLRNTPSLLLLCCPQFQLSEPGECFVTIATSTMGKAAFLPTDDALPAFLPVGTGRELRVMGFIEDENLMMTGVQGMGEDSK